MENKSTKTITTVFMVCVLAVAATSAPGGRDTALPVAETDDQVAADMHEADEDRPIPVVDETTRHPE